MLVEDGVPHQVLSQREIAFSVIHLEREVTEFPMIWCILDSSFDQVGPILGGSKEFKTLLYPRKFNILLR